MATYGLTFALQVVGICAILYFLSNRMLSEEHFKANDYTKLSAYMFLAALCVVAGGSVGYVFSALFL